MKIIKPDVERVWQSYSRSIQSLAYAYLKNKQDAEDVAQDVLITYLTKSPTFVSAQKEKAWLITVAANRCKSLLRSNRKKEQPLPEDLSYLPKEEYDVMTAMLKLDAKYRLPLHLFYYEGYSIAEIGKILKCRPSTVGSWLARGREKIKNELGEDYFEE